MATAKKSPAKKSAKKTSAKTSSAKKSSAKKSASGESQHCWPGFEPVPGKEPGTKGSCKPKAHQTAGEKKADSKAKAATTLSKGGGKGTPKKAA